jgi:histidinol-phosphate aminotransferase
MVKAHSYLNKIANYIPGTSKIKGAEKIIKLSSNENALECSNKAIDSYKKHSHQLFRYADGSCNELRQAIANKHNINSEQIVCGAGSDEIISLITLAFAGIGDEIIYSEHGFLMYPISANKVGANAIKAKEINLKTNIRAVLEAITEKTKIIFIANPNNPTGSYLNKNELQELLDKAPPHILLVLDNAYEEFVTAEDYPQSLNLIKKYPNLIITKTFSKIYGLASLRLGWSYSSLEIATILNKVRGPFNVGGPAQYSAIEALSDHEFITDSISYNNKWLKIFFTEIAKFNNIKAHPSVANFILLDFFHPEICQKANGILLQNNIILREMTAYNLPQCLRMTIGKDWENEELLKILTKIDNSINDLQ